MTTTGIAGSAGSTATATTARPGGSNYWGVEEHKLAGKKYFLGADPDRGLRIFTYQP